MHRIAEYPSLLKKVVQHTVEYIIDPPARARLRGNFRLALGGLRDRDREANKNSLVFTEQVMFRGVVGYRFEQQEKPEKLVLLLSLFPKESVVTYSHPGSHDPDRVHLLARQDSVVVVSTTTKIRDDSKYPAHGYKNSDGIQIPFAVRKVSDQIQHGGIFISPSGTSIVDYATLKDLMGRNLSNEESVLEADWYMDSDCFDTVVVRKNLQSRLPFNAIGQLIFSDGSVQWLTVGCSLMALHYIERYYSSLHNNPDYPATLAEIAEACEAIRVKTGASKWVLAGTEYNGGGMYIPTGDWLSDIGKWDRDYFVFLTQTP